MKELGGVVDTRNIGGDVVDQFSIGVDMSSASRERESLVVDCRDQPRTQQDTSTHGAVEIVVQSKRGQNLKEEEAERETDTTRKRRGAAGATAPMSTNTEQVTSAVVEVRVQ